MEKELVEVVGYDLLRWRVLSFDDLINSKIRASRPKDLLDRRGERGNANVGMVAAKVQRTDVRIRD
jgi:hypothetical protein